MTQSDPTLSARLEREARFHDAKYGEGEKTPRHYATAPTQYVYERMRDMLGDLRGRHVLEYGCGEGWITRDLARMGAAVSAFDISPQALEKTKDVLGPELARRCQLGVMPAETLVYPADSFDLAVGFAIIHHLDLPRALAELHRVLKPGGVAYFAEPLATNPAIQLYRRLTPQFRTADERPLVLAELPQLLSAFSGFAHQEYYLSALGALLLAYVPGGMRLFPSFSRTLHRVDRAWLDRMPSLGRWAWYSIIRIVK